MPNIGFQMNNIIVKLSCQINAKRISINFNEIAQTFKHWSCFATIFVICLKRCLIITISYCQINKLRLLLN